MGYRWIRLMTAAVLGLCACSEQGPQGALDSAFAERTTNGDDAAETDDGEPATECGNGVVEADEECDEGAGNSDTGACRTDCTLAVCGDGLVGPREGCDDGNDIDDDDCSNACVPATCGNAVIEGSEQCDDGNQIVSDACLPNCTHAACGDGYIWVGMEECDDGGESAQCDADCSLVSCGDGQVNAAAGEACDDANHDNTDACIDTCEAASCGDGYLRAGVELCDGEELGTETCLTQGYPFGDIACDDTCNYDITDCNDEQPCPAGGAFVNDYCWYASTICETTQAKCASVGLTGSDGMTNSSWDAETLAEVAAQLGLIAGGVQGCCVTFGWIKNATLFTHNYGPQFYNWGSCFSNMPTLKACEAP